MNTCDTCKHWGKEVSFEPWKNMGECKKAVAIISGVETFADDDVAVYGTLTNFGDTDAQPLITGRKFGCVHWVMDGQGGGECRSLLNVSATAADEHPATARRKQGQ